MFLKSFERLLTKAAIFFNQEHRKTVYFIRLQFKIAVFYMYFNIFIYSI